MVWAGAETAQPTWWGQNHRLRLGRSTASFFICAGVRGECPKAGISRKVNQISSFWNGNFPKMVRVTIKAIVPFVVKFLSTLLFSVNVYNQRKLMVIMIYCSLKWKDHGAQGFRNHPVFPWCPWKLRAREKQHCSPQPGRPGSELPHSGRWWALITSLCLTGFQSDISHELSFAQRKKLEFINDTYLFLLYL